MVKVLTQDHAPRRICCVPLTFDTSNDWNPQTAWETPLVESVVSLLASRAPS